MESIIQARIEALTHQEIEAQKAVALTAEWQQLQHIRAVLAELNNLIALVPEVSPPEDQPPTKWTFEQDDPQPIASDPIVNTPS